jgi:excisionase family DNA binding protein
MFTISDLPMLTTPRAAAEVMGLTEQQVRSLIRDKKIAYVRVGKRAHIPRAAIEEFITQNTVAPCRDEIQEHGCVSSKNEDAFTSSGLKAAAAGSAARALQIASELKSRSPNSSTCEPETPARVILLRS